jgi:hypothetical protein
VIACSPVPAASQAPASAAAPDCGPDAGQDALELQRTATAGPFYMVAAAKSAVASCRVSRASQVITLNYTFRDGTTLRVIRNPAIEYNNQELRLTTPLSEDPRPILTRAERASFGADGCGIDWTQKETQRASDDASATETIHVGDVCNCQARVRTDAAGRVTGLVIRSTC